MYFDGCTKFAIYCLRPIKKKKLGHQLKYIVNQRRRNKKQKHCQFGGIACR